MQRFQHFLHSSPAAVPLIVLLMSVLFFGALVGSKFFSAFALTLILQQVAITGIVGIAQTLVVLTAGIDLSVGAIMVLTSVIMGQFTMRYGFPAPLSIFCGISFGGLLGLINGGKLDDVLKKSKLKLLLQQDIRQVGAAVAK